MKIYLLDNFDSFTYNLVDQFRSLGFEVVIYRNDISGRLSVSTYAGRTGAHSIGIISWARCPCRSWLYAVADSKVAGKLPILGICLGHQALVEYYGGTVGRAGQIVHGKASPVSHNGQGMFSGLPSPLSVARYHSLVATKVPDCLEVIASFEDMPMAIEHREHASVVSNSILNLFSAPRAVHCWCKPCSI
ncbi:MAG: gamma-glutamyl-gamma-aminobutyrate hydrolase family protein [Shewanella fodinae]|nr:gamma-glutamyl-gamma-aminobutyrate hydrolase family protein [Shewanella fodinae]